MAFKGFEEVIQKLSGYLAKREVAKEIILERKEIAKMVQTQLAKGLDGNNQSVYLTRNGFRVKSYSAYTKLQKSKLSGLASYTGHITNFMTGNFYRSLYVFVYDNGSFEVRSQSPLIEIIKQRSGLDIINLSKESEEFLFKNRIAPDLQKTIDELFQA
jgi:hypothetical protein